MTLPLATQDALAHSRVVEKRIRDEIDTAGSWIPFEQFMHLALYAPGLGYYSSGATKLGILRDGSARTARPSTGARQALSRGQSVDGAGEGNRSCP